MDLAGSKSGSDVDYLRQIVDRQLADTHTAIPALVETFDAATQMIECIPMIRARVKDIDGNEATEDRPKLVKVPLITPYVRMLGFSLTMPITPGDVVMLIFNERGLDYWQESGDISDPPEDIGARMHDITDGIAAIGPIAKPDAIIDYQIDSAEVRNRDRTSSYQLWDDELEARITNGTFIREKVSGDIDMLATLNLNVEAAVDEGCKIGVKSTKVIGTDQNTDVGANVNKLVAANEAVEITGEGLRTTASDSTEYSDARLVKNADGKFELHSDVEVILKAPIIRLCGETIIQGNLVVTGDVTATSKSFNNHVHPGVLVGTSSTSTPVAGAGPGPAPATCPGKPSRPPTPVIPGIPAPERRGP